ncbi:UDP-glucuronic acid decarboxylase 1 [Fasciolopsis buskii]|uniref:UDP-glucuronic acid decarboxylase 1 n=1 Tax=Fasciolopsis buskii TaxID=27845 RepID=A0A8E0RX78_9TREM|nr:UDP-glucuronic acid decarboxylase 1 [Fasciolopsis buski]
MASNYSQPVNLGNPQEFTVLDLAYLIKNFTGSTSPIVFHPAPVDDPQRRRPIIQVAKEQLNWEPMIDLKEGLEKTLAYFRGYVDAIVT